MRLALSPTPAQITDLFLEQRRADAVGVRIHEFLAIAAVFLAGFPTTFIEFAALSMIVCTLIRLTGRANRRVPGALLWDTSVRLLISWALFMLISALWTRAHPIITPSGTTPFPRDWLHDVQSLRFAGWPLLLYPVLERRRWLILALALGLLAGECSQLVHTLGRALEIPALTWNRLPGRNSGWWDPVVGGSVLCAGLGLFLAMLLPGKSEAPTRTRLDRAVLALGLIGSVTTLIAIFATGSRGAWIGAAFTLVIAAGLALGLTIRSASLTPRRAITIIAGALALVAITMTLALTLIPGVLNRARAGYAEVSATLQHADYSSDTGKRLGAWVWGARAFSAHPILGVGVGNFRNWPDAQVERTNTPSQREGEGGGHKNPENVPESKYFETSTNPPPAPPSGRGVERAKALPATQISTHTTNPIGSLPGSLPPPPPPTLPPPPSLYVHALATTGLVGSVLLGALVLVSIRAGWRGATGAHTAPRPSSHWHPLDRAPALALVGLLCAGIFDSVQLNQQTMNLLLILIALCVGCRPPEASSQAEPAR